MAIEGEWVWLTSKSVVEFAKWYPGNPSNSQGNENCMELMHNVSPHWNDNTCTKTQHYICEKPVK